VKTAVSGGKHCTFSMPLAMLSPLVLGKMKQAILAAMGVSPCCTNNNMLVDTKQLGDVQNLQLSFKHLTSDTL
jgi:hypothetical protein